MRKKRFSVLALLCAVLVTAGVLLGGGYLALCHVAGEGGLTLLKSLYLVRGRFVGQYDEDKVVDSAMSGMIEGMGDKWSYYIPASGLSQQQTQRENEYVGVGVTVDYTREDGLLIIEVIAGGPAEQAGLKAGEVILAADGHTLAGEARYTGAEYIRGAAGTSVSLALRGEDGKTRTVSVVRATVESNPVSYTLLESGIGYIQISNFFARTAQEFRASVESLQAQGARALIFDVRDNGGGYLDEMTAMLDELLPEGPIFISRTQAGRESTVTSDEAFVELPMAVLVNQNTYSAAEFFAAELQERDAAWVVGEQTTGKGFSQQIFTLPNGGAVNISTNMYFTGSGRSLIETGVTPDSVIALTDGEDTQLTAAITLLQDAF